MLKKYQGSLLGLAVGDALGTTLEFEEPGTFQPISDMIGGGPFDLEPGQLTDDTSIHRGFEGLLQTERFMDSWPGLFTGWRPYPKNGAG